MFALQLFGQLNKIYCVSKLIIVLLSVHYLALVACRAAWVGDVPGWAALPWDVREQQEVQGEAAGTLEQCNEAGFVQVPGLCFVSSPWRRDLFGYSCNMFLCLGQELTMSSG